MNTGWICSRCNASVAPSYSTCPNCLVIVPSVFQPYQPIPVPAYICYHEYPTQLYIPAEGGFIACMKCGMQIWVYGASYTTWGYTSGDLMVGSVGGHASQ